MAVGIGVGRFVYTPILPSMMAEFGLSKFVSGLIASANFVGYLVGALAATRATLPGPARVWLPGALALSAVTTAAMGATDSVPAFIALRFAGGIASALALSACTTTGGSGEPASASAKSDDKFAATLYIDDRALHFTDWASLPDAVASHPKYAR